MPTATSQDDADVYTLHEAAQLLGVSLGTVRRMIARQELHATRIQRPQGYVWRVHLEPAQHPAQGARQPPAGTVPQDPAQLPASILATDRAEQLASVVRPLVEAAVAPLRAELADVRALLSTRDQELGQAQERLRALEAAQDAPRADSVAPGPVQASAASVPRRRPWWQWWRA